MSVRCDICGAESTFDEVFHRLRVSRRETRIYCPSCWTKRQTIHSSNFLLYGGVAGIIGLLLVALAAKTPWGWYLLGFCLFVVFQVICIVPHELGHAIAAWSVGMRVFTVSIGSFGREIFSFQPFGVDVVFRSIPLGGSALSAPKNLQLVRLKKLWVVLCGPLANAALLVAVMLVVAESNEMVAWVGGIFFWSNLFCLAVNLWPWKSWLDGQQVSSDGLALLTVPFWTKTMIESWHACYFYLEGLESRERGKPDDAKRWFKKGVEFYPDHWHSHFGMAMLLLDEAKYGEARQILLRLIEPKPIQKFLEYKAVPPEHAAQVWFHLAWADLMSGNPDLLPEADKFSLKAYERMPWLPQMKGTRGRILVECGAIDQGVELLQAALVENEKASDKALNAWYLALAMKLRKDLEQRPTDDGNGTA